MEIVKIRNERGAALLQVMLIGALFATIAYVMAQMMTSNDRSNLRIIHRNENITYSILLSDQVADKATVKGVATIPNQQYQ